MKNKEKNKKEININFKSTELLRDEYSIYCKKRGYSLSARLRALIEMDIKGEIK
jgi:hypothetical protein